MLKRIFDQLFRWPLEALTATMDIVGKDTPAGMKVGAMISRATHALSRPRPGYREPDHNPGEGNDNNRA